MQQAGSIVTRSFCPLPSRTVISLRSKLDVLDAQVQALEQPQSAAVQEPAREEGRAVHVGEQLPRLVPGQDDRQAGGPLGTDHALEQADLPVQDVPVQEDEGAQGLGLCRRADVFPHREV